MKIVFLAPFFLAAVMVSAQARIGEDLGALVSRYGEPLSSPDEKPALDKSGSGMEIFQKNGFQIDARLLDGVSVQESFKKLNGDTLTSQEIDTLLADNSQGHAWQAPQTADGQSKWMSDDGSIAISTGGHTLKIISSALLNIEAESQQLEKKPSLEGF